MRAFQKCITLWWSGGLIRQGGSEQRICIWKCVHDRARVSKYHRLTVVRQRKIPLTLRKILRFVCASWKIPDFIHFQTCCLFLLILLACLEIFWPFSCKKFSRVKLWQRQKSSFRLSRQDTCVSSRHSQKFELVGQRWKHKLNYHTKVETQLFLISNRIFRQCVLKKFELSYFLSH